MKNSQNITIALLLVSAGILTALLIGMHVSNTPSAEAQVSVSKGQYIVSVGTYSSSQDLVYIMDITTGQVNAYAASRVRKRIQVADSVDVGQVFKRLRPARP